jgi:hypothetical protein
MNGAKRGRGSLKNLELRVERWRERHGGKGRRMPDTLWAEIAEVARVEGVDATARLVRVNRERLARLAGRTVPSPEATAEFVEIDTSRMWTPARAIVRLRGQDGEEVEIEVSSASPVDVIALAQAFWSRRR